MLKQTKLTLLMAVTLCVTYITVCFSENFVIFFSFGNYSGFTEEFQQTSHVLYTNGCKVPKFDPFDPTVIQFYEKISGNIPCKGKSYIFVKDNKVILDETQIKKDYKDKNFTCTYKAIYRNPKNKTLRADNIFEYGEETVLNVNETLPHEFVKVFCKGEGNVEYEDFLASTPLKPSVEERCTKETSKIVSPNILNIIVVGIDSVSKLNFERHFKMAAEYLRKNLSAFEFNGYMKVADNTFPNLTPLLTGHFVNKYFSEANKGRYFDDLDFIWKNFSSIGYRTLFAEDAPLMGTYNYVKNGFQYPPTDYFFRPLTLAIEDTPWHLASKVDCWQAIPEIVHLFNYLRSFLTTMQERPYFAFTWAARLTHGVLNKAGYADKPTFELLKDINNMGLLNRSVLVFMSDHGIRFGGIRKTFIGKIEERMPFLFISFPKWFLDSHAEIKNNLILNQGRLTTPFDLHEMFVDIYQMMSGNKKYIRTPYGISLFREISDTRNCKSAFILPHWCVCHDYKKLNLHSYMASRAAKAVIAAVNNITSQHRSFCEELRLDVILDARVSKPENDLLRYKELKDGAFENTITFERYTDSYEKIMVTVRTVPGKAEFESTVRKIRSDFKVFDVSRINIYGNQGDCVNDADLRKYCFCKTN